MKLFYSTILIPVLLILTYQQQLFSQETNDVQSLRIVDASYPFDNHTIPNNLHLIMDGDLMSRIRSNSATNQDLAVTLELSIRYCNEVLLRDTIMVNNLRPLRDTTVIFQIDEDFSLKTNVSSQCKTSIAGGIYHGEIIYELNYETFKIESDGSWNSQDELVQTFGYSPSIMSKEDPSVDSFNRWISPNINFFPAEVAHGVLFEIDNINHNYGESTLENWMPGIYFYCASLGLINPNDHEVTPTILVLISEYLETDFDQEKFNAQFSDNLFDHPLLETISFSIIEETFPANSSNLINVFEWFDKDIEYLMDGLQLGCFLLEGKTFLISVIIEENDLSNIIDVAYNRGVSGKNKVNSFFYNSISGLHFNHESPYHPVIRIHSYPDGYGGTCLDRITNTVTVEEENYFNLYPNPATDLVHIHIGEDLHLDGFTVFSVDGKKVMRQDIDQYSLEMSIDLSSLPSGFYIFEFFNAEEVIRRPLIIKPY